MKLSLGIALQLLFSGLASETAFAEVKTLQKTGYWTAFGGSDNTGRPVCGVMATGGGRVLTIKQYSGSEHFTVQIFKQTWQIPQGHKIPVAFRFDSHEPWTANASAIPPDGVSITIPSNLSEAFFREFRLANTLIVSFPEGSETSWSANLTGSAAITYAFADCVLKMYGGGASQPYGRNATQPYGAGPPTQPSQPYRRNDSRF